MTSGRLTWRPRRVAVFGVALALAVALWVALATPRHHPVGPNDAYQNPKVAAEEWRQLFEGEGREIYVRRDVILRLADAKPGMSVVDVGAGTGLFTMMLSDAVGPTGRVYAEEILGKFAAYVAERAAREGRTNVVSVLGTERGIGLPPASVNRALLCDVYHHFDHPQEMLASIYLALRDRGELLLVDFRREPGRSPAWILEHVRAGADDVVREIEQAGFVLLARDDGLRDNYARRFRRR